MNQLAHESSPYLLQHKDNPVEWQPWGAEALERARRTDKPIFLSIGYSACHWCHVMAHESFEDPELAALMNERFVCIKVDREERPDLDHIYMQAVQAMSGRGGWPLSVFLTPDLEPFYGGTYWPPVSRGGMPGFDQVLLAVSDAWTHRRAVAVEQAARLTAHLRDGELSGSATHGVDLDVLRTAVQRWSVSFDERYGGFGGAPKFPRPIDLQVLMRSWFRTRDSHTLHMATLTLDKMAAGGMYDHLGGGFARYAVDERWLVPHFEKMLYDNALLTDAYLDGYLATGHRRYAQVARETLDYVLRDMLDPEGGFHSAEDADSEGEEGKFYLWTIEEIRSILGGELAARFCRVYDVTPGGNFEGQNILHKPKTMDQCATVLRCDREELEREMAEARTRLLEARSQRVRPGKDDKVLVSWNALMIHALARAARILDQRDYLAAATRAAEFLLGALRRPDGRLLHSWRQGDARLDAYLDDYSYLIHALVTLYESTFAESWLDEALRLTEIVLEHFPDATDGGFFYTADDHEALITRTKELYDSSVPSSNAMMATALVRLGKLTGRHDLHDTARTTIESASRVLQMAPEAASQLLVAIDLWQGPTWEIALTGRADDPATQESLTALYRAFIPRYVVAFRDEASGQPCSAALDPLFEGRPASIQPTAYVCQDFACQTPVQGAPEIQALWRELAGRRD